LGLGAAVEGVAFVFAVLRRRRFISTTTTKGMADLV
jgi:hypothetical protein